MKKCSVPIMGVLLIHAGLVAFGQSAPLRLPTCPAAQLSLALDDENGYFNGMSHSGTLIVLRNLGPSVCTVPARPILGFENASHHPLPISIEISRGMHPGPVILPVAIPVAAEVTSQMRWVSSDAFGANNSVSPVFITLTVGGDILRMKFTGQLFGPANKQPTYSVDFFKRDPAYAPAKP